MDKLTKEKIKVLEWMGKLKIRSAGVSEWYWLIDSFNPQNDKEATFGEWAEIMGNMSEEETEGYYNFLFTGWWTKFDEEMRSYHVCKPSARWKALIQVLEEE